jgi:osmoprotectant transport system ATP-binding protein
MSAVSFRHLGKSWAGVAALSEISTNFPESSVTAIIGRSGSGKSTLLRTINGLVVPDSGTVEVFGEPIDYSELPRLRRRIGYAVQGSGLFPHLSVADNIALLARLDNWSDEHIRDRSQQLLDLVQLESGLVDRYPHELSGGQQQRVALCRTMMLDPQLLLLDEPFAALDPLTRLEIHEEVLHLQNTAPRAILLVTHDMREALKLADNIVVIDQGRIVIEAPVAEIRARQGEMEPEQLLLNLIGEAS